jgi:uncharacterized RDD family membrane protein YckC
MENKNPAGFLIRFLAYSLDLLIHTTLLFAPFLLVVKSSTMIGLATNFMTYAAVIVIPSFLLLNFYSAFFTSRFGGTIGKLLTGLRVTDADGKLLDFKYSFFRQTVGYMFASLLFWVGLLAIIRDKNKQGWHDKATGSYVWKINNLWLLGLGVSIVLIFLNIGIAKNLGKVMKAHPLSPQLAELITELSKPDAPATNDEALKSISEISSKRYDEGRAAIEQQDYSKAQRMALEIIVQAKNQTEESLGYTLTTQALLAERKIEEAVQNGKKSTELSPNFALARAIYALALISNGQKDEAVTEAQKASDLDPTNEEYNTLLESIK